MQGSGCRCFLDNCVLLTTPIGENRAIEAAVANITCPLKSSQPSQWDYNSHVHVLMMDTQSAFMLILHGCFVNML